VQLCSVIADDRISKFNRLSASCNPTAIAEVLVARRVTDSDVQNLSYEFRSFYVF